MEHDQFAFKLIDSLASNRRLKFLDGRGPITVHESFINGAEFSPAYMFWAEKLAVARDS